MHTAQHFPRFELFVKADGTFRQVEKPQGTLVLTAWRHADSVAKPFERRSGGRRVHVKATIPLGVASIIVWFIFIIIFLAQIADAERVEDATVLVVGASLVIICHVLKEACKHVFLWKQFFLFARHFEMQRPITEEDA